MENVILIKILIQSMIKMRGTYIQASMWKFDPSSVQSLPKKVNLCSRFPSLVWIRILLKSYGKSRCNVFLLISLAKETLQYCDFLSLQFILYFTEKS